MFNQTTKQNLIHILKKTAYLVTFAVSVCLPKRNALLIL